MIFFLIQETELKDKSLAKKKNSKNEHPKPRTKS